MYSPIIVQIFIEKFLSNNIKF